MVWNQGNRTSKQFADEIILHSDAPSSWYCSTITHKSEFIFRDMKEQIAAGEKYTIDEKGIVDGPMCIGKQILTSKSGYVNMLGGYNSKYMGYDRQTGERSNNSVSTDDKYLSSGSDLCRSPDVQEACKHTLSLNKNIHSKWWSAMHSNMQHLLLYSTNKLILTFQEHVDITPLDIVLFTMADTPDVKQITKFKAGYWIVGEVVYIVANRKFNTAIHLYREALNDNKG